MPQNLKYWLNVPKFVPIINPKTKTMRRLLTVFVLSLMIVTASAQKGDMKIGPLVAYGSEIKNPGFGIKFHYGINDRIRLAPDFIYYLEKNDVTWWELNVNGHYTFSESGDMAFYALGGLNLLGVKVNFMGASTSDSEMGINLGAGVQKPLTSRLLGVAEAKYTLSSADQLVISVGFLFNLN